MPAMTLSATKVQAIMSSKLQTGTFLCLPSLLALSAFIFITSAKIKSARFFYRCITWPWFKESQWCEGDALFNYILIITVIASVMVNHDSTTFCLSTWKSASPTSHEAPKKSYQSCEDYPYANHQIKFIAQMSQSLTNDCNVNHHMII
jgi:hypothetical protein